MARDDEADGEARDGRPTRGEARDADSGHGGGRAADRDSGGADGDLDDRVAAVYGGPLASFVAERDALARELRSASRRDDAARVRKLRKPKLVAWALDAGARADPGALAALVTAVDGLREAQEGGDVRAAIAALRGAEAPVVDAAARASGDHGQPVERTTLAAAVRAVVGDPDAFAALRAGRLVDVPAGGGLGVAIAGPAGAAGDDTTRVAGRSTAAPTRTGTTPDTASTRAGTTPDTAPTRTGTTPDTAPTRAAARPDGAPPGAAGDRGETARGAAPGRKEAARRLQAARRAVAEAERAARGAADEARRADRTAGRAEATARDLGDRAAAARRRADEAEDAAGRARGDAEAAAAARDRAEAELAEAQVALRALGG